MLRPYYYSHSGNHVVNHIHAQRGSSDLSSSFIAGFHSSHLLRAPWFPKMPTGQPAPCRTAGERGAKRPLHPCDDLERDDGAPKWPTPNPVPCRGPPVWPGVALGLVTSLARVRCAGCSKVARLLALLARKRRFLMVVYIFTSMPMRERVGQLPRRRRVD